MLQLLLSYEIKQFFIVILGEKENIAVYIYI